MAPFLGLYLEHKGFTLLEIAQLSSILMVTKVLAPNVWGVLGDRTGRRLALVRMGAFATLIGYVGFFFAEVFWQFAAIIIGFSFFWNAILPQFEVVTLYNLGSHRDRYSRIRLWGSVGFILVVLLLGQVFEHYGIEFFPWALLMIISGICIASWQSFSEPEARNQDQEGTSFLGLLSSKNVAVFFVVCFLLQLSHGSYYTYFSIYMEKLGHSKSYIGMLWALGVFAEVILFVYMHRWFERKSDLSIMFVALVLTSLRWLLTAVFPENNAAMLFAQTLHALSFGAMHAAAIHFVHRSFNESTQGRAQALYSSLGFGLGGALGAVLSGAIVTAFGYEASFLSSSGIALLAAFLLWFGVLRRA